MALGLIITIVSIVFTVVIIIVVFRAVGGTMGDKTTLQNGVPGTAQVMSLAPTGTVINDMYYVCQIGLRVQLPAQASYDVMIKQSVPITAMARVNPGASVGVKVDPADQTKVVIDWNAPAAVGVAAAAGPADLSAGNIAAAVQQTGGQGLIMGSAKDLLEKGQRVLGVLTEFADTGNTPRSMGQTPSRPEFIDDPLYVLTLQLHVPNTTPVEAKVVHRVPRAMAPTLAMGMQLNCAVNPSNPTRDVAVDWGDIPL
jgi:hypothetical protein